MKRVLAFSAIVLLTACGADTATTAATAAALKKDEIEQGEKTADQLRRRVDAAAQQLREHAESQRQAVEDNEGR